MLQSTPPTDFIYPLSMLLDANVAIEKVYQSDWGRIVATLIRLFGDFDLAEEVAQEAFTAAVDQWRISGIPDNPRAWLIQAALKPMKLPERFSCRSPRWRSAWYAQSGRFTMREFRTRFPRPGICQSVWM